MRYHTPAQRLNGYEIESADDGILVWFEDYEALASRLETQKTLNRAQADIIKGYEEQEAAMVACLTDIAFECDGREDIDNNGGPNFAMRVMNHVRAALEKTGVEL